MNETTENFWKAWCEPVQAAAPIFFRLYYNGRGKPVSYSMEDLPGNYIEIDAETYQRSSFNVCVVDGKLVHLVPKKPTSKLKPSNTGTTCAPNNVSVVVTEDQPHTKWSLKSNESN
jgi:thiol-disulfide isomerase/thioredoxin